MLPDITRGSTYRFTYTHKHNKVATTLDGCTVIFTVKNKENDVITDDSSGYIQKTVASGSHLPQSGTTLGKTVIHCLPSETLKTRAGVVPTPGNFFADIKVIHADGTQFTEFKSKVKMVAYPTNRTS